MASSKKPIAIAEYDANHTDAVAHFGNDVLWAYTPVTFLDNGYASNLKRDADLLRYADPMKEALSRKVDDSDQFIRQYSLRTRFTDDEVQIMQGVRSKAAEFCETAFGRRVAPINSILSAVGLFRVVKHIQTHFDRPLRILEIGPGAGYLGAFLIESGHEYIGVDTTQSFYLWQSRFLHHFASINGLGFQEQAHAKAGKPVKQAAVTHIPWWHFVSNIGDTPLKCDIVISEQALSEMHAWASRFSIFLGREILAESEARMFLFSDFGHPTVPHEQVHSTFGEAGYSQVLSNCVYGFTPGAHQLPGGVYALDTEIPLYNPSGGDRLHKPSQVLRTKRKELPLDMEFRRFLGIWPHYDLFVTE